MEADEALRLAAAALAEVSGDEAAREAKLIVAHLLAISPQQLLLHWHDQIDQEQLMQIIKQRQQHQPLQYILGEQEFMGLPFTVTPAVLIPRGDSERPVEAAIELLKDLPQPVVADICCGCGAYAVSLAYYLPQALFFAVDISHDALAVAEENAKRNGVITRINFLAGDLLQPLEAKQRSFDMIISNPPYVRTDDIDGLSPEVRQEPFRALNGGTDGLDFYRRLSTAAGALLKDGGWLVIEHGFDQAQDVSGILKNSGWSIKSKIVDYGGNDRAVIAQKD